MEIFIVILVIVSGGTMVTSVVRTYMSGAVSEKEPRRSYARAVGRVEKAETASIEAAKPRKPIPAEIQAEIDQTVAWWDNRFHQALYDSGVRVSHDPNVEPEYIEERAWDGTVILAEYNVGPRWLEGCVCYACTRAKASVVYKDRGIIALARTYDIPDDDWELWEDPAPARPWCG